MGGGGHLHFKIFFPDFGPLYRAFFGRFPEKICNINFRKRGVGGWWQRPFGIFRKLIRFVSLTRPYATKLFAIQFFRNVWNVKNFRKQPFLSLFCFSLLLPRFPNFHFMLPSLDQAASFSYKSVSPLFLTKKIRKCKKNKMYICETHSGAGTSRWTPSLWKMLNYRMSTQSIS